MYQYNIYGLGIHSPLLFPELKVQTAKADIQISLGKIKHNLSTTDLSQPYCQTHPQSIYFFWPHVGTYLLRQGREIVIEPEPHIGETDQESSRLIRFFLLAILHILLWQKGYVILHASSVAIKGQAILFTGNKFHGKSTMAAALYQRGHNFVADDTVVIKPDPIQPTVLPSFPWFKLWSDAAEAIGKNPDALPQIASQVDKRELKIERNFQPEPLPLGNIYLLGCGQKLQIQSIQPQAKLLQLIANTYHTTTFKQQVLEFLGVKQNFAYCSELAQQTQMYSLERPSDLTLLPEIAQLVENHAQKTLNN